MVAVRDRLQEALDALDVAYTRVKAWEIGQCKSSGRFVCTALPVIEALRGDIIDASAALTAYRATLPTRMVTSAGTVDLLAKLGGVTKT